MHKDSTVEAVLLLANPQRLKALRNDSSTFVNQLAESPTLLRDMLDIGLRPTAFQREKGCQLGAEMPALAIDTLVSLYEDFIDLLAYDRVLPKDRSLQGLQFEEEQEQQAEAQVPSAEQFQLLSHIHRGIMEGEPQETAYYYLCRLIGPLSYQRPVQLMRFYQQRPAVMAALTQRMQVRPLVELFCKLLECQSGKQFFREYKHQYLLTYIKRVQQALDEPDSLAWLQGLHQLYKFLTQKMEEGSDNNKYIILLQSLNTQDISILSAINRKINTFDQDSVVGSLRWVEEMLKHDSHIMGQNSIRLSLTYQNRRNSISNTFYRQQKVEQKKSHHLSQEHLLQILTLCQQIHQRLQNSRPLSNLIAIALYRVLYFLSRVWLLRVKQKELAQPHLLGLVLNEGFFQTTLERAIKLPQSTILHNCVKQLIIECLREKILAPNYFYRQNSPYLDIFLNAFPRKSNIQTPFSQQLYHIYKEVVLAESHVNNEVENRLLQQSQRMGKLIGGDPRKLQADSLRGSSNAFSESSQNIEEVLEFDLHSQNSLIGSGSGVGVVKVHNSSSIQCRMLQEERIIIEGAEDEND